MKTPEDESGIGVMEKLSVERNLFVADDISSNRGQILSLIGIRCLIETLHVEMADEFGRIEKRAL